MEAVQESIDTLSSLEERIARAAQLIGTLRSENKRLEDELRTAREQASSAQAELTEAQAFSTEFQKENAELEKRVSQLSLEIDTMKGERKQVKIRIEKLLNQLDLLSAS